MKSKSKRSQEEIIGFALIIIIVAVVMLIFLGFTLKNAQKEPVESYEVGSFLQAYLQYTTNCEDNSQHLSIQKVIFDCTENRKCLDGRNTCEILSNLSAEIVKESWPVEGDRPVKGYTLNINLNQAELLTIQKGNITDNFKSDIIYLPKNVNVAFSAYY